MRITELKEEVQRERLEEIIQKLCAEPEAASIIEDILHYVTERLDEADEFGTQGWKHRFGYDD